MTDKLQANQSKITLLAASDLPECICITASISADCIQSLKCRTIHHPSDNNNLGHCEQRKK